MVRPLESCWPDTRDQVIKRDKGICQNCGAEASIVHHLSYNMFDGEKTPISKLINLCPTCHRKYHSSPYQGQSGHTKASPDHTITIKTDDLLTFSEAAKILNVSRPTIYNLVLREKLHPVLIGKNRYLLRTEIERLE